MPFHHVCIPNIAHGAKLCNCHCEHVHLADLIFQYGSLVNFPCQLCFVKSQLCVVIESCGSYCLNCVCYDYHCKSCIYNDANWINLYKEEEQVSSYLVA